MGIIPTKADNITMLTQIALNIIRFRHNFFGDIPAAATTHIIKSKILFEEANSITHKLRANKQIKKAHCLDVHFSLKINAAKSEKIERYFTAFATTVCSSIKGEDTITFIKKTIRKSPIQYNNLDIVLDLFKLKSSPI